MPTFYFCPSPRTPNGISYPDPNVRKLHAYTTRSGYATTGWGALTAAAQNSLKGGKIISMKANNSTIIKSRVHITWMENRSLLIQDRTQTNR